MAQMLKDLVRFVDALRHVLGFILFGPRTVGWVARTQIAFRVLFARLRNRGRCSSTCGEQLLLVAAILKIPHERQGCIAEFGCYKGLSTVALSIAARYAKRKLLVFDSFQGLPEPTEIVHQVATGKALVYRKGDYVGSLEEVRSTVARYGEINQVEFVPGFFSETLPLRPVEEKYALIFEDADLADSVRDVLAYAWPRLQEECFFFSHEALDLEAAKVFFDEEFWLKRLGCRAPGLVGVGLGLPIDVGWWGISGLGSVFGSSMAGIIKRSHLSQAVPDGTPRF